MSYSFFYPGILSNTRTGPARRYNLERCRKELEKSCSDYQSRGNHFPPTPRSTPCAISTNTQQQQPSTTQQKTARSQTGRSLNETSHAPHTTKRLPFQYSEEELRQRAHVIKIETKQPSRLRLDQPPVSTSDPFDGHTGHDFSNDVQNNELDFKEFMPRRHPTLHRQNLTQDEFVAIRDTAARLAKHCTVRDEQPYPEATAQEALHRIRSSIWSARAKGECQKGAGPAPLDEKQDNNGISITEGGCIIQRGFDISPMASSPADTVHSRCDSGIGASCTTPDRVSSTPKSRPEPLRPNVRNSRGARVPVCFRKRDIFHERRISHLSALITGHVSPISQPKQEQTASKDAHQPHMPQPDRRVPIQVHPLVFFSGSSSSGAVVSDSEDDGDEEQEGCEDKKIDSAASSTVCADEARDVASGGHGSVVTLVVSNKLAETVETSNRLPQRSAPPSPLSSKFPVLSPPRVERVQTLHPGTPLPQQPSRRLNLPSELRGQAPGKFSPLQQDAPQAQSFRSQQTVKVFLAHQQRRHTRKPSSPRAQTPCQALGLRLPSQPDTYNENTHYVSALLEKIERNGGIRPANFSWDHVAPIHGFSTCGAFRVLD